MESEVGNVNEKRVMNLVKNLVEKKHYKTYKFSITDTFKKGENYLGLIRKATLEGVKENGDREKLKLIIKTLPDALTGSNMYESLHKFYETECFVYEQYHPLLLKLQSESRIPKEFRINFAECYAMSCNVGEEALIFEDLSVKGYVMQDRLKSLNKEGAIMVTKTIATFHALAFAVRESVTQEQYAKFVKHNSALAQITDDYMSYMKTLCERILPHVESEKGKEQFRWLIAADLKDIVYDYFDLDKTEKECCHNILIHSDVWINNFLFKYEEGTLESMILLDWQTLKFASPLIDLFYSIFLCLDGEMLSSIWNELTETYYATLKSRLDDLDCDPEKCYPEAVFRKHLKDKLGHAVMVISAMGLPLTLNEKEDSVDLSDLNSDDDSALKRLNISKKCIKRLNEIVDFLFQIDAIQ